MFVDDGDVDAAFLGTDRVLVKEDLDGTGTNRDHYVVNIHVEDHQDFIAAMYQEAEDLGDD